MNRSRKNARKQNSGSRGLLNTGGPGNRYMPVSRPQQVMDLTGPWLVCPPGVRVVLPYHEEVAYTVGTYFGDRVWSLNSVFDPDVTATGHQPMGFDQWSSFYNNYRVLQTEVELRVNNASATSGLSVYIVFNDDPTPITSTPVAGESPYTKELMIGSSTGSDARTFRTVMNVPLLAGRTLAQYRAEENYGASVSASPVQQFYIHTFFRTADGTATVDANFTILLKYVCEIFERKKLGLS